MDSKKTAGTIRIIGALKRRELFQKARSARKHAFAPRSGFRVGAAVLTAQGEIFSGGNIEVGMNELGLCAERTALYKAVSEGQRRIKAVAVATAGKDPVSPCGVCREALYKFAVSSDIPVYMISLRGKVFVCRSLGELLPWKD